MIFQVSGVKTFNLKESELSNVIPFLYPKEKKKIDFKVPKEIDIDWWRKEVPPRENWLVNAAASNT